MKRHLLFFILVFGMISTTYAQVAINNTGASAEGCAILDVSATNKGMLIPRVQLTDLDSPMTPIENPVIGLLVFNTLESSGIEIGFYYWQDDAWNHVLGTTNTYNQTFANEFFYSIELYEDNDFSSPSQINMPDKTAYYGWCNASVGFQWGTPVPGITIPSDCSTGEPAQITVEQDGLYKISFCISFSGTNNSQVEGAIYHTDNFGGTGTERTRIRFLRKLASAGDIGAGSAHGLLELHAGDSVDLRFRSTSDGEILNVYNVNFILNKVGEL